MLYDSFGRVHTYLRISITDACNLRCVYCMPDVKFEVTSNKKLMSAEEIETIVAIFVNLGIKKIRLTGGEPLVRKDAGNIIKRLSNYPIQLTITTNALLANEYIDVFKEANIGTVNVSLDTLNADEFFSITKRNQFEKILSNIYLLLKNNFILKVNIVVMKSINENSIFDFVEWTKDFPIQVRFIEFMPFDGNKWNWDKVFSFDEILNLINTKYSFYKIDDHKHDTSKKFRVIGHQGTFGIISTMTKPFCDECNRIRLTADGKLKNCLFSNNEIDLLTALRNNEDIIPLIFSSLKNKKLELGGQFDFENIENRSMIRIGG